MEYYDSNSSLQGPLRYLHNISRMFKKFELLMGPQKPNFKNDYEYVDYALSILQRSFTTPLETFPNDLKSLPAGSLLKCTAESKNLRNEGNIAFKTRRYIEANHLYTLSIAYATAGSTDITLAYGNRSAVLFEKQYYKECLEDIQRAFDNNYPSDKKAKLLKRQAEAKELLPTQKKVPFHGTIPTIKDRNVAMPSASDCIRINKNEEFGRHVVANKTISPGEVLLVEKSYSQYPHPPHRSFYCSECLEVCYNLIPCEKCAGVLYCSITCRRKAYVNYHRYECVLLKHIGYDIINWTATRTTLKGIKEYDTEDTESSNVYRSDRYKELSDLTSIKSTDKDRELTIFNAIGAAKVFYVLKNYTDIFAVLDIDNKENILKSLLFNDICVNQTNGFEITKYDKNVGYINYGRAIYSALSMFNHACSENVGLSFYGSSVVLRARRKIEKGEQCFVNYGANPSLDTTRKRQMDINQLFEFMCKCQACLQNWPREETLGSEAIHLMSHITGICTEVAFSDIIDEDRKRLLLQKTFTIMEQIQGEAPYLIYVYTTNIFNKLMLEGNTHISY